MTEKLSALMFFILLEICHHTLWHPILYLKCILMNIL